MAAPAQQSGAAEAAAYTPAWRAGAGALKVVSRGGLLLTLSMMLFSSTPPLNPLKQIRLFLGLFAAPEAAAWCVARAMRCRVTVADGALVLEQGGQRTEIPLAAIAAVEAWHIPLPSAGVSLRLKSGRRFDRGLATAAPDELAATLIEAGAPPEIAAGTRTATATYARARRVVPRRFLENPILKFGVYSLVPTIPSFRLHQFISYGGTFGEYYTYGLKSYLLGFGLWWASFAFSLLCLAAGLRLVVEAASLLAAFVAPSRAVLVRRIFEVLQRLAYYVGMPAWIAMRFMA